VSAFLASIPVIISHNHSVYDYYNKYYHFVEWSLSFITDRVICISEVVNRFVNKTQRINAKKLITIHNGIDDVHAVSEKRRSDLKNEFGIPVDHSVICTISHMEEHKGIKYLLKSASLLLQSRNDVSFIIVGEGSLMEELRKLCVTLKIEKNVIIAGLIYVTGAIGIELIGGRYSELYGYNVTYFVITTLEELLEMVGVVVFIYALTSYIDSEFKGLRLGLKS
jgi:glycosyltransferase involved in cell wall biosynthesis